LTARGIALTVGAVTLVGVARLLGVAELHVVAATIGLLLLGSAVAVRLSASTVAARRMLSAPRLLPGRSVEVTVELRNASRLPATLLLVSDDVHRSLGEQARFVVPGLRPGRVVPLRYTLTGTRRGRYEVGPLSVRVRDPFGLAERTRRYTAVEPLVVYPVVEPLGEGVARGAHGGTGTSETRRLFSSGDEFFTMREYVQGDDLRMVHWPSTAHRQTLMVRQQELPWQAQATVLLDTRVNAHGAAAGNDAGVEKAISVAASALWHLADRGYSLRLATEASTRAPAVEAWTTLMDRLAELRPTRSPALAPALSRLGGPGGEGLLLAALGPPVGTEPVGASADVRALLRAGRGYGGRVAVVCVDAARPQAAARGAELVELLRASSWRATTVEASQSLAEVWPDVTGRPRVITGGIEHARDRSLTEGSSMRETAL